MGIFLIEKENMCHYYLFANYSFIYHIGRYERANGLMNKKDCYEQIMESKILTASEPRFSLTAMFLMVASICRLETSSNPCIALTSAISFGIPSALPLMAFFFHC